MKTKYIIIFIIIILLIYYYKNYTYSFNYSKEHFSSQIRIHYLHTGIWGYDFNKKPNFFNYLFDSYSIPYVIVSLEQKPEVIITDTYNKGEIKKIRESSDNKINVVYFTGENYMVKADADVNVTFRREPEHNNIRLPLWILYGNFVNKYDYNNLDIKTKWKETLNSKATKYDKDIQLKKSNKTKFCCFVYSNSVKFRENFCLELSKYKKVDCGGSSLNNVNGKIKDKIIFQKDHKFCIAYENSETPGYTTEKIMDAYRSNCIPIYRGSKTILEDFNPETFINSYDYETEEELINYIKKVDNEPELYNSYLNKPVYSKEWLSRFNDPEQKYFKNICNKIFNK